MINSDGTAGMFDRDFKSPILMWPWEDAPQSLKDLTQERARWVVHVPPWFTGVLGEERIDELYEPFSRERHEIADGSIVHFIDK